jgi:hypothetical protein
MSSPETKKAIREKKRGYGKVPTVTTNDFIRA